MEGKIAVLAADYSKLIDAETWAFIERTNAYYPPDTIDYTIEQQRAVYDRMCGEFHPGYPEGVTAHDSAIGLADRAVSIRTYQAQAQAPAAEAMVLYFHGGGFILGGLDSHDSICAEICGATGFEVVAVDYRLAPEHVHPAQFDDALAAFDWAAATFEQPILLCGDSAGGNLAAAVSQARRRHNRAPIGQVLIYAALGGPKDGKSYLAHPNPPMLTARDIKYYNNARTGGCAVVGDPTLSPLVDTDFSGLPPTVLISAECDPLSSDSKAYRDCLLAAGSKAVWFEEPGLVHGYLRARHSVGRARESFARITNALETLGRREWTW